MEEYIRNVLSSVALQPSEHGCGDGQVQGRLHCGHSSHCIALLLRRVEEVAAGLASFVSAFLSHHCR